MPTENLPEPRVGGFQQAGGAEQSEAPTNGLLVQLGIIGFGRMGAKMTTQSLRGGENRCVSGALHDRFGGHAIKPEAASVR